MAKRKKWNSTELGKEIKKGLVDKDMNYSELALAVGTSLQYISYILYGKRSGRKYIDKIAEVLQIDLSKYVA